MLFLWTEPMGLKERHFWFDGRAKPSETNSTPKKICSLSVSAVRGCSEIMNWVHARFTFQPHKSKVCSFWHYTCLSYPVFSSLTFLFLIFQWFMSHQWCKEAWFHKNCNCDFIPFNCTFIFEECDFISHNCDLTIKKSFRKLILLVLVS